MPYPPAITLRPCTVGGSTALESGTQLVLSAEITASRSLKWGATGWQFPSLMRTVTGSEGAELSFSLPVTDLAGWRLNDDSGSIIDVSTPGSYTHTYTIKLKTLSGGRQIDERIIGPFVLPTEDLSPIDLDLMLPAPTIAGGVVSVPGTWDARVVAAEAAAVAVAATLTTTDAGVASFVADEASTTRAALLSDFVLGSVTPAGGTTTPGAVLVIGPEAARPGDIGTSAIVGGGAPNYENVIGGILANVNTAVSNIPAGGAGTGDGDLTAPNGNWIFIWGGYDNVVNGWASQIQGFHCEVVAGSSHGTISGGSLHELGVGDYTTIGGGTGNKVSGNGGTIAGGVGGTITGNYGFIGGGQNNTASGSAALILGGSTNTASGVQSAVMGGLGNESLGDYTITGGLYCDAVGTGAVALGRNNTAAGPYSQALGRQAVARQAGELALAGGAFATDGDAQSSVLVVKRAATNATPAELALENASFPTIPESSTWIVEGHIVGRTASGRVAAWRISLVLSRGVGNTAAIVGTPTVTLLAESASGELALTVSAYGAGMLRLITTGAAAEATRFVGRLQVVHVTH